MTALSPKRSTDVAAAKPGFPSECDSGPAQSSDENAFPDFFGGCVGLHCEGKAVIGSAGNFGSPGENMMLGLN